MSATQRRRTDDLLTEVLWSESRGAEELDRLRGLAEDDAAVRWDRLLFSAKESLYKAWFPLTVPGRGCPAG